LTGDRPLRIVAAHRIGRQAMAADFPVVHLAGPGSSLLVGLPERGMPPILGWSRRAPPRAPTSV